MASGNSPSGNSREPLSALIPGIIAAASFGIGDTFTKVALGAGIDVLSLALVRGVVGLAILFCYLRIGAPAAPPTPRARIVALILGLLFGAIVYGLFKAIDLITVPVGVLTYFIYPLLTGIAGALFGIERLSLTGGVAALVAFLGLALTIGAYPNELSLLGISFAVGAALCRTVFLLVARTELQKTDPRLTTWYSLLSSTGMFVLGVVITMHWQGPHTAYGWVAVAIVSVCTAVATLTLYISTVRIGPFRSALIMNLEPLIATLLSAPLLGEILTPLQGLGAAMMLAAIVAFQIWR